MNEIRALIFHLDSDLAEVDRLCRKLKDANVAVKSVSASEFGQLYSGSFSALGSDIDLSALQFVYFFHQYNCRDEDFYRQFLAFFDPGDPVRGVFEDHPNEDVDVIFGHIKKWFETYRSRLKQDVRKTSDPTSASFKTDLLLNDLLRDLDGESDSETIGQKLFDIRNHLINRIKLLAPPYKKRKFAMSCSAPILGFLRGFETYAGGYDDVLVYAYRVHINRLLCRARVRALAAERFLAGELADEQKFRGAVAEWDALYFGGKDIGTDPGGVFRTELRLDEDPGYRDHCRCDDAFLNAYTIKKLMQCPDLSQSSPHGYSDDIISIVFGGCDTIRIPRYGEAEPGAANAADGALPGAFAALAQSHHDFLKELLPRLDSFSPFELTLFKELALRSAALCEEAALPLIAGDIRRYGAEAANRLSAVPTERQLPSTGAENALRAVLGFYRRNDRKGSYDVFISHRNADDDPDNRLPRRVYNRLLAARGLVPFLDVIDLAGLGSSEYTDALSLALDNSDNLALIVRTADDFKSEWLNYEWMSFRFEMNRGRKKSLFILKPANAGAPGKKSFRDSLPEFLQHSEIIEYDPDDPSGAAERLAEFIISQKSTL